MPYHLRCIIPSDRYCHFDGLRLAVSAVEAEAEAAEEERRLVETKVNFVDRTGQSRLLSLLEISNELHFAYATHLAFMEERDLAIMPVTWGLPQWADETMEAISPTSLELGIVDQLENGKLHESIFIKFVSDEIGFGVFTSQTLAAGAFLGEYVGIVLATQNPGPYSLNFPCLDGGHEINAADTGNLMRLVNHAQDPNSSFQHVYHESVIHTVVRTIKSVDAGEQISVDYSPSYWVGRGVTPQELS